MTADQLDMAEIEDQPLLNLENEIFGRLLVVEPADNLGLWWCRCECNNTVVFGARTLLGQEVKSCGDCGPRTRGASWPSYPTSTLDRTWQKFSVCNQYEPETFYQETTLGIKAAKAICVRQCPVRLQCLAWGLDLRDTWGVLGGLSGRERRAMLVERGAGSRPVETEARLLAAGVQVLESVGDPDRVSRAAVATAAGMSAETVKRYFPAIKEMRSLIAEAALVETKVAAEGDGQ